MAAGTKLRLIWGRGTHVHYICEIILSRVHEDVVPSFDVMLLGIGV